MNTQISEAFAVLGLIAAWVALEHAAGEYAPVDDDKTMLTRNGTLIWRKEFTLDDM